MNNKQKTTRAVILLIGMLVGIISAYAHSSDSTRMTRKAQVTFAHPIGTNGEEAPDIINNFSFNLFYGISGGVDGAEIGILVNKTEGNVKGFQFAGLGNSVSGSLQGLQASGLYNVMMEPMRGVQLSGITNINQGLVQGVGISGILNLNLEQTRGAQFAGISNITDQKSDGAYFAGIANVMTGNSDGAYFGGIANVITGSSEGAYFGGIANVITGSSEGAYFGGIANVSTGDARGAQFSGLANAVTGRMDGALVTGLANLALRESRGMQLAGLANVSVTAHKGAQIAGLVNYSHRVSGLQLAPFNFADTVERGVPVGLLSIVVHGYRRIEFEGNEVLYLNMNFKTGTSKFYNIFSIGYRPEGDKQHWGVTYGIGTLVPIGRRFNFNFDVTATHLNEDETWTNTLNLLNRLKFNFSYLITKRLEVIAGPSFNVAVSQLRNEEGNVTGSSIVPSYSFYDETIRGTNVKMYAGFNVGIRF